MCNEYDEYLDQLISFRNNLTDMVEKCEDIEPLYEKDFIITFNGLSVKIAFGATEFYSIQEALDNIIEEQL